MRVSYVRVKYHHINIIAIRLYESVISKDVVDRPNRNRNNFLNDKQYGFYYHRSSADVLTVITGRNSKRIVNKERVAIQLWFLWKYFSIIKSSLGG